MSTDFASKNQVSQLSDFVMTAETLMAYEERPRKLETSRLNKSTLRRLHYRRMIVALQRVGKCPITVHVVDRNDGWK